MKGLFSPYSPDPPAPKPLTVEEAAQRYLAATTKLGRLKSEQATIERMKRDIGGEIDKAYAEMESLQIEYMNATKDHPR